MTLISDLYNALFTNQKGMSLRKLMAVAGVVTGIYISGKNGNADNAATLLLTWLAFACLCQGMVTFGDLLQLRTGRTATTTTTVNAEVKEEIKTSQP